MKKLWNETRWIERFLYKKMPPSLLRWMKQKQEGDPVFSEKIKRQHETYQLIKWSGRRQLKKEIRQLEKGLLGPKGDLFLKQQIDNIFSG